MARVAEPVAHVSPVLLFDVRVVVAAVRPAARVEDGLRPTLLAPTQNVAVDKLSAIVAVQAQPDKGWLFSISFNCSTVPCWPRPCIPRISTQVVQMSVLSTIQAFSPATQPPHKEAVLASVQPGSFSCQEPPRNGDGLAEHGPRVSRSWLSIWNEAGEFRCEGATSRNEPNSKRS